MVTIVAYDKRTAEDGREFFTLTLQGGIEIIQSNSGKQYVTAKKANLPSTFDELTCRQLIGQQMPGCILKVKSQPYNYKTNTGDVIILEHTYQYSSEEQVTANTSSSLISFSMNESPTFLMKH